MEGIPDKEEEYNPENETEMEISLSADLGNFFMLIHFQRRRLSN
jgi:hypothetical protein